MVDQHQCSVETESCPDNINIAVEVMGTVVMSELVSVLLLFTSSRLRSVMR